MSKDTKLILSGMVIMMRYLLAIVEYLLSDSKKHLEYDYQEISGMVKTWEEDIETSG